MSKLTVYRASAGSGKTYLITLEYLKLLFNFPYNYRHILAVTFTKKAAAEMKTRIVEQLYKLANGDNTPYLNELENALQLKEKSIRQQAELLLKYILHDYSRFYIETIDSFFQTILRSFIREIGIQTGFRVELDNTKVLSAAIDLLFNEISNDDSLKNWLVEFIEDKISENKKWDIKKDLLNLGYEIFREEYILSKHSLLNTIKEKSITKDFKVKLFTIKNNYEKTLTSMANKALNIIDKHNLYLTDFSGGRYGPAGYFINIIEKKFVPPGIKFINACNDESKWYTKESDIQKRILDCLNNGLLDIAIKILDYFNSEHEKYYTSIEILKSLNIIGLFNDIENKIREYSSNENLLLLSDCTQLISEIIKDNDCPFIYEKSGTNLKHFMIDEFQDTSRLQWNNFKPLIVNSLSQNYLSLIVGDVKQSIYRWRNSDWTIMTNDIYNQFSNFGIEERKLEFNYRSKKNIVFFNNFLFQYVPNVLGNYFENLTDSTDIFQKAYKDTVQQIPSEKDGGFVKIEWIESSNNEDFTANVLPKFVSDIENLQLAGYKPNEIAILVRKKDDARKISDFLAKYKTKYAKPNIFYDLISEESMSVSSSPIVKFIVAIIKYFINPNNSVNNYLIQHIYNNYINNNVRFSNEYNNNDFFKIFSEKLKTLKNLSSTYELTENIIRIFRLSDIVSQLPYLTAFTDIVYNYSIDNSSEINNFIEWWDEEGKEKTISANELTNAMQILTIHKSKGLEFKVVLIPFCNWPIEETTSKILWLKTDCEPFSELNIIPVKYSSSLENTIFKNDYIEERMKSSIDNLNLLYVAFTRASEVLISYCLLKNTKNNNYLKTTGNFIHHVLFNFKIEYNCEINIELFGENKIMTIGNIDIYANKNKAQEDSLINIISNQGFKNIWENKISIKSNSENAFNKNLTTANNIEHGKIMHELFRNIIYQSDIEIALRKLLNSGYINAYELPEYRKKLNKIFENDEIRKWFEPGSIVKTETPILLGNGKTLRPDRIMINDKEAIVVDYKFGTQQNEDHKIQVSEYLSYLKKMNFNNLKGYIWYVNLQEIIEVV
jgi:ATP-dependent exoDNAse (exonuclease V) beta subunit